MLSAKSIYAISDKQYAECKKLSPEFSQAEEDLNTVWKQLNSLIKSKENKHKLLINQKNWLKDRDDKYVHKDGSVDITNFTYETKERVADLFLYKEYVKNNYLPVKLTGQIIQQTESRYDENTAYHLYTKIVVNNNEYDIWILLCSSEDKIQHKDVDRILGKAEASKDKCSILVDYDILGKIQPISFVNPSKNEKCNLNW
ncbi:MAG: DUF1311 domain-containing protein [Desulfovibrio sp.]|nr:DUF1311 domain-containing protein [Desulfovibrio sp.]